MTDTPTPPTEDTAPVHEEDATDGPIGIFPSWRAIYTTVLIYTAGLTLLLYVLTRLLDFSVE